MMAEREPAAECKVPEEVTAELHSTAVSEEKLQEARKKSLQRIFGSSQVFLQPDNKPHPRRPSTFNDIVQAKVTEHYERGLRSMRQEKWEEAVISFSKAINLDPERMDLYVKRAEAFLQLCDFQSAALNLQKACCVSHPCKETVERLALTYYLQGQTLFEQESFMEALESFTRAAELLPKNFHYQMRSISCLAALERYGECIQLINKHLEMEDGNPDLYVLRARLYDRLNKATLSYLDLQTALSIKPGHTEAIALREKLKAKAEEAKEKAISYAVQGRLQEALKKICFAIENNPSSAEYHIFRGTVYKRLKDFTAAVEDFVMATQLCSGDAEAGGPGMELLAQAENQLLLTYNDFAVQCYAKGFYQEGVQLLNKALRGERNKKELYVNRGDCFFQLGEMSFALADYEQAFELDATDWGVRTRSARLLDEMGLQAQQTRQYQLAESHFSEAIKKQPLLPQLYHHRAQVRRYLQNTTDAQQDAVISIMLTPHGGEVAPALMNFFPGKTLEEITSSKLAQTAQSMVEESLQDLQGNWKDSRNYLYEQVKEPTVEETEGFSVCRTEQQVMSELIHGKMKTEIQKALNRRRQSRVKALRTDDAARTKQETFAPKTLAVGLKPSASRS